MTATLTAPAVAAGFLANPTPTYRALSADGKAAVARELARYRITRPALVAEILSKVDAGAARGNRWYHDANALAVRLADQHGVTVEQSATVIAALSPRTKWRDNVRQAEIVLATIGDVAELETDAAVKVINKSARTMFTLLTTAVRITRAASLAEVDALLTGVKRRSFAANILRPDMSDAVTVDTWMARAAINAARRPMSLSDAQNWIGAAPKVTRGGAGYVALADAVRAAAIQLRAPAPAVQASYWERVRGAAE